MKRGYAIPLNQIHRYYREMENSKENPKKQKKRKRSRYEIKWIVNTWRLAQGGEWGTVWTRAWHTPEFKDLNKVKKPTNHPPVSDIALLSACCYPFCSFCPVSTCVTGEA